MKFVEECADSINKLGFMDAALMRSPAEFCKGLPLRSMASIQKRRRSRVLVRASREFLGDKEKKSPAAYDKSKKIPLSLMSALNQISRATGIYMQPKKVTFTGIQLTCGAGVAGYVLASPSGQQLAGLLLITLCISISLSGYARCLWKSQQMLSRAFVVSLELDGSGCVMEGGSGSAVEVCLEAHKMAKGAYSYDVRPHSRNEWEKFLASLFYEPSAIYMALNCWGLYAVGQATLCRTIGGGAVPLAF